MSGLFRDRRVFGNELGDGKHFLGREVDRRSIKVLLQMCEA